MKFRRVIAALCALTMCLTMCMTSVFAQDTTADQDYSVYSYYEIASGLVPGRNVINEQRSGSVVCVMRIYADPSTGASGSSFGDYGHTFLTFLNTSTSNITVGRHTVAPNKMVSIGKFGKFEEYKGAFYNAETSRKARLGWYTNAKSIYMDLTASQLQTVSTYLKNNQAGYAVIGNNCASYAAKAWNSVLSTSSKQYIDHYATPTDVYQDLEDIGGTYQGNGLIKSDYPLCYYDGATRKECDDYV